MGVDLRSLTYTLLIHPGIPKGIFKARVPLQLDALSHYVVSITYLSHSVASNSNKLVVTNIVAV